MDSWIFSEADRPGLRHNYLQDSYILMDSYTDGRSTRISVNLYTFRAPSTIVTGFRCVNGTGPFIIKLLIDDFKRMRMSRSHRRMVRNVVRSIKDIMKHAKIVIPTNGHGGVHQFSAKHMELLLAARPKLFREVDDGGNGQRESGGATHQ